MKQLIIFLRKHKVLTKYKKNFKKQRNIHDIETFCSVGHSDSHISSAFDWNNTDEGHKFWSNLSIKWRQTL